MGLAPLETQGSPRATSRPMRARSSAYSLLELDPDLGLLLPEHRHAAARTELAVRVLRLARGSWAGGELSSTSPDHLGLLLIGGAIAREVVLADTISTELLGPGDLIRPWSPGQTPNLLRHQVRWQVLEEARLAVLNRAFGIAVLRYPEVNSMLLDRLNRRAERIATMKAIAQLNSVERRLLALFWHLAEDWGRITTGGVLVPLTLSHRLLGELVGARRPTVSSAATKLARERKLTRRADGSWLLADGPDAQFAFEVGPMLSHRRRLLAHPVFGGRDAPVSMNAVSDGGLPQE
jgi:CRP/FNR family cyclic AMP-dependent transcriptional regulator